LQLEVFVAEERQKKTKKKTKTKTKGEGKKEKIEKRSQGGKKEEANRKGHTS
jgi:hypothetical protein